MSELESSVVLCIHENSGADVLSFTLRTLMGEKVLEGDGELLVRSVAKIVEDDEGGERKAFGGARGFFPHASLPAGVL